MDTEERSYSSSRSHFIVRWSFVAFRLLSALTSVEGQFQVIGSLWPVMASPGDDVILPCHVEPPFNVTGLTVEWSKPDLQPDPNDRLSRVQYVHLYRDAHEVPGVKIQSYIRRTTLFTDGLRRGNISLKISNVTVADEGRYRCFIPKLKGQPQSSVIQLIVDSNSVQARTTETSPHTRNLQTPDPMEEVDITGGSGPRRRLIPLVVFCVFLILSVGVGGYLFSEAECQKSAHESTSSPAHSLADGHC